MTRIDEIMTRIDEIMATKIIKSKKNFKKNMPEALKYLWRKNAMG